jgi:hypothetical protein
MDKRFWSGAIVVVTAVVAGASVLPGLLLGPNPVEAPPVAVVAPAPKDPVLKPPEPAPVAAKPEVARVEPAGVVAAKPIDPSPAPPPAAPVQADQPAPIGPPAQQVASAPEFPPVQPIGIATQSGPDASPQPTQSRVASARPDAAATKSEKARTPRMTVQDAKKRKRSVRPAIYPLREFFAWQR